MNNTGRLLRERRKMHRILLKQIPVNHQALYQVESGNIPMPLRWIPRISPILMISREEFKEALIMDYTRRLEDEIN